MFRFSGKNYIGGSWVSGKGPHFQSIDPGTYDLVLECSEASQQQVLEAITSAKKAFQSWKKTTLEERISILNAFSSLVKEHARELATVISKEVGKPLWDSLSEVQALSHKASLSSQAYQERCATKTLAVMNGTLQVIHKPYGPVAVLGPYNFPAHLPHGQIIPALLAGNTVLFKPSEYTPATAEALIQLWERAGLPEGVINLLLGAKEVGSALIDHSDVKGVYFTGSSSTGKAIEAHALQFPHRITALEMGGNNPLIFSHAHDIDAAVYTTIQSAFITSGQRCSCARRLIVVESDNGKQFLDYLVETTKKLIPRHYAETSEPYLGPVISNAAAQKIVHAYNAVRGKILLPLTGRDNNMAYLTPGITDATGMELPDSEIFGPVLFVKRVKNIDEAIIEANKTRYGLTAGIISDDKEEQLLAINELEAGVINCNLPLTGASGHAPFGGIKDSGNCRPAGYYASDFTAYPVSSQCTVEVRLPETFPPGYPRK